MPAWLNTLLNLPVKDWTTLAAFVGVGALVAIATQVVKHFRGDAWANPAAMARFVVSFLSFLSSTAYQILYSPSSSLSLIATHFAVILSAAHVVYWLSVNPAYKYFLGLLEDASKWRASTAPQSTAATVAVQPPAEFAD